MPDFNRQFELFRRQAEGVPTGPLEPLEEAMTGAIPSMAEIGGQSLLRLIGLPIMDSVARAGTGKIRKVIQDDEDFKTFSKDNPAMAEGLLKLLDSSPALLLGALGGTFKPTSDIASRSPGAELLGKMAKEKKVGSTVSDLIDDLITLKAKSAPSPPEARVLDPKNANDQLEILLRR